MANTSFSFFKPEFPAQHPLLDLPRPADYHVPTVPFINPFASDVRTFWPSEEISPKTKLKPLPCTPSLSSGSSSSLPSSISPIATPPSNFSRLDLDPASFESPTLGFYSAFSSIPEPPKKEHIPRPPNAFMLFRSSLVKGGYVPASTERRQQNISRIAGEIWRMLPESERIKWQEKAAQKLVEHQRLYPNYKFQPSPRKTKKEKTATNEAESGDWIRTIREKYTGFVGPAPPKSKRRKGGNTPSNRVAEQDNGSSSTMTATALFSPVKTPTFPHLPSHTRKPSLAQIMYDKRPSTSLGFNPTSGSDARTYPTITAFARPSSAGLPEMDFSSLFHDVDFSSLSFEDFDKIMSKATAPLAQAPYAPLPEIVAPVPLGPLFDQSLTTLHSYASPSATQHILPVVETPSAQAVGPSHNEYTSDAPSPVISIYETPRSSPAPSSYLTYSPQPSAGWEI